MGIFAFDIKKPEKRFQRELKPNEVTAVSCWLGVNCTATMPQNVKYVKVRNMERRYHKEFDGFPFAMDHGIGDDTIYYCLHET